MQLRVVAKNTFIDAECTESTHAEPWRMPRVSSCPPGAADRTPSQRQVRSETSSAVLPLTRLDTSVDYDFTEEDCLSPSPSVGLCIFDSVDDVPAGYGQRDVGANEEAGRPPPQRPFLAPPWCSTPWKAHAKGKRTGCLAGCYHKRCGTNCPRCHDPRCRVVANNIPLQVQVVASNYLKYPLVTEPFN
ncbi:unnamed protein product [Prorocentrum cordatum]|uniref:Uncharacterized protein n=1 Tax=Prorocentrum cordatum TaxID=2364126 RepID=A0ABN9VY77_9DINO|nr:unnamed protein product [Polarella glacialis]